MISNVNQVLKLRADAKDCVVSVEELLQTENDKFRARAGKALRKSRKAWQR